MDASGPRMRTWILLRGWCSSSGNDYTWGNKEGPLLRPAGRWKRGGFKDNLCTLCRKTIDCITHHQGLIKTKLKFLGFIF